MKKVRSNFSYALTFTLFFSYCQKLSLCVTAPTGRMVDSATGRCDKSIDDRMSLKKETEGVTVELGTQCNSKMFFRNPIGAFRKKGGCIGIRNKK